MKYLPNATPIPVVELTRRNLNTLLNKLSTPDSMRMIGSPVTYFGQPEILVKAVEDIEHYADRPAGEVYVYDAWTTLIEGLRDQQHKVCAYGRREGTPGNCDCKYQNRMFLTQGVVLRGENTGCPELSAAIQILEAMRDQEKAKEKDD